MKSCVTFVAMAGLMLGVCAPLQGEDRPSRPPAPKTVAEALKQLNVPVVHGDYLNEPIGPKKCYLLCDCTGSCKEPIDFLTHSDGVDETLLKLANSSEPLRVRVRAAYILVERGNTAIAPVLNTMMASSDEDEKYMVWETYADALAQKKLPLPLDVTDQLAVYVRETDQEVRQQMEKFFAYAKSKAAVKPLLETLKRRPGCEIHAVWALGLIGDTRAVPGIIEDFNAGHDFNYETYCTALGRLASPQAIDFLIDHLDADGAVEALGRANSKKALPALRKHLECLKKRDNPDKMDLRTTRIAIVRLSQDDCRDALMKIVENREEDDTTRLDAFQALREYDTGPFYRRILEVYKAEAISEIRFECLYLLKDSKLEGVTEAIIHHAFTKETHIYRGFGDLGGEHYLLEVLNNRLGTTCGDMAELRAHLEKLSR